MSLLTYLISIPLQNNSARDGSGGTVWWKPPPIIYNETRTWPYYWYWSRQVDVVGIVAAGKMWSTVQQRILLMGDSHLSLHDDVIKWKHFPRYWPFVRGIRWSPVNSPHKGQWRGALMFSFICAWINGWVNNREAGGLRRHRARYDVTVMHFEGHGDDICCCKSIVFGIVLKLENWSSQWHVSLLCALYNMYVYGI